MLGDFNAWFRSGLESIIPGGYTDDDLKIALNNCYKALCHNKYQKGKLACPLKLDDVGAVIISYIAYFTMEENKDRKYYFDEYSDRKDPYRKGLIALITKGAKEIRKSITEEWTNDVLSYLYWALKRGKCPKVILRPKEEAKFRERNWYIKEPYRSIIQITEMVYNLVLKVFKTAIKVIETTIDGVENALDWSLFLLRNLPFILTGGVVLIAGIQIYGIRKNGKFYGENLLTNPKLEVKI